MKVLIVGGVAHGRYFHCTARPPHTLEITSSPILSSDCLPGFTVKAESETHSYQHLFYINAIEDQPTQIYTPVDADRPTEDMIYHAKRLADEAEAQAR